jgi:uncharacterized protein (DUF427 family)
MFAKADTLPGERNSIPMDQAQEFGPKPSEPSRFTPGSSHLMGELRIVPTQKRVRALLSGVPVVDSTRAQLLYHKGPTPDYYFPRADLDHEFLVPSDHRTECPTRGEARYWSVEMGDRTAENAVWNYPDSPEGIPDLSNLMALDWNSMDAWFEEEEEVFVHPRDPYHRVDILESDRRVLIRLGGTVLVDSVRPVLLFETGLPVRYYVPKMDVRTDLMTPMDVETRCPYKGFTTRYWGGPEGGPEEREIAWCYDFPLQEAAKIAGRIAFFDERVDLHVDGKLQDRPETSWS